MAKKAPARARVLVIGAILKKIGWLSEKTVGDSRKCFGVKRKTGLINCTAVENDSEHSKKSASVNERERRTVKE
jgi:hypothetical protein